MHYIASDNYAPTHPAVMQAIILANEDHAISYGDDPWCEKARTLLRQAFGQEAGVYFVTSGTAANVLGLRGMLHCDESVVCTDVAHIANEECGAVEAATSCKLDTIASVNGKLCPQNMAYLREHRESVHFANPRVVSVTQLTELGTSYTLEELQAIGVWCKENDYYFHMDGARLANAAAGLGASLSDITVGCGVDVLSFGGTKNGLMYGEAIIVFNQSLNPRYGRIQKQGMQLLSKLRFIGAQFTAYMEHSLWLENARHANNMATLLHEAIKDLPGLRVPYPVDGNNVFARMPAKTIARLHENFYFYIMNPNDAPGFPAGWPLVRFVPSFCTTQEEIEALASTIQRCCR